MRKPLFVLSLLGVLSFLGSCAMTTLAAAPGTRPNILFIYADDWGWGDLAMHGHPHLKTPNIDRIAREGTDFHQFTVCNPVCSPSRTAIVTGNYPARHRIHEAISRHDENVARGMPDWLDPRVTLLPRLLKDAGYTTGHFGKWHLGGDPGESHVPQPSEYGYDEAAVWNGAGTQVWEGSSFTDRGSNKDDKTAAAVEHTNRFLRATKGRPFYVNLWIQETHYPVRASDEDKKAYPDTAEPQRTYYSAITRADRLIGTVLDTLDELGVRDNTIVIFSSDNGPENMGSKPSDKFYYSVGSTGPLLGRKRSLYLGGVNVPFIVRWPGQVPAGRVDTTSVLSGVDILPTLLAAAQVPMPEGYRPDGVNVSTALKGETFVRSQPLFWDWRGSHVHGETWPELAMRDGDWGLLMTRDEQRVVLYDSVHDRSQENDVASAQPERVAAMTAVLRAWKETLPPFVSENPLSAKPKKKRTVNPEFTGNRARAFDRWDTNRDGVLTIEEYREGLSNPTNVESRFKNFDKNGDGKLTRDEFVGPTAD